MSERTVHHGRNIKRIREIQGLKQEALAIELGNDWSQKKVSLLESKETIEEDLLDQIASALHVSPEAIKSFNDEAVFNNISNIFNDHAALINCQINPMDKWIEALEENKRLYERLLQSEREKVELLNRVLEFKK